MNNKQYWPYAIVGFTIIFVALIGTTEFPISEGGEETIETSLHIIAIIVSLAAIYWGRNLLKQYHWMFAGLILLSLVHGIELLTEVFKILPLISFQHEMVEHIFFIMGVLLIGISFYKIGEQFGFGR